MESLGRQVVAGEARSLGPFFEIETQDQDFHRLRREVDRKIRLAALKTFA